LDLQPNKNGELKQSKVEAKDKDKRDTTHGAMMTAVEREWWAIRRYEITYMEECNCEEPPIRIDVNEGCKRVNE